MIKGFLKKYTGYLLFILFIVFMALTFQVAEKMAKFICNVTVEDMTNFLKFALTLLFSTILLPALKKEVEK